MSSFHHIPSKRLGSNSTSHLRLLRTQAWFPCADRNITHNLAHCCYSFCREMLKSNCRHSCCSVQLSKVQITRSHSFCTLQLRCHDFTISPQDVSDQTLLLILDFSGRRLASFVRTATSHTTLLIAVILFARKCKAQIVVILFVNFSSVKLKL